MRIEDSNYSGFDKAGFWTECMTVSARPVKACSKDECRGHAHPKPTPEIRLKSRFLRAETVMHPFGWRERPGNCV
jgi:hypothetical protein